MNLATLRFRAVPAVCWLALAAPAVAQSPTPPPAAAPNAPAPTPAPQTDGDDAGGDTMEDLLSAGRELFDTYAPPQLKAEFRFPTREEWDLFAARLQKTLESGSLAELAGYDEEAHAALIALRALPDYQDYADWLEERIDEIEAAKEAERLGKLAPRPHPTPRPATPPPPRAPAEKDPAAPKPAEPHADVPLYDLWVERIRARARPERADEFLPLVKRIFEAEGVPGALAWLAETESTFNPSARSPAGARGLFQLMPATARGQGLSLLPLDERTNPEKSARAAAKLLRALHRRFASWPLALAAYNAGEGRIGRTLKANDATTFAEIAEALPGETRLYVPKVLATLTVREGVTPEAIPAPR